MNQLVFHAVPEDPLEAARATIGIEIEGLRRLQSSIGTSFLETVRAIAATKGRVIITGIGKSGHIGRKMAATFASTGTPALFVHAGEAGHGDLGMVCKDDLVIAISKSGESAEFMPLLQYCRRFSVPLVAMTENANSSLSRYANITLQIPKADEACPLSLAPMTSTTLCLVLGDALAAAMIRERGFERDDFAVFHPSGKLGAQLLRLSEVLEMRPELTAIPRVTVDASLADVIASITEGRRGATAVAEDGRMAGVITDGDLRRALGRGDIADCRAGQLMSRNPLKIQSDNLAVDALAMCERHKVSAIFVTDVGHGGVIGLIHLQDLLALGIA